MLSWTHALAFHTALSLPLQTRETLVKKKNTKTIELPQTTPGVRRPPPTPDAGVEEQGTPLSPMSRPAAPPPLPMLHPSTLLKQKSWSPDTYRDEAWLRRKGNHDHRRNRRSKSVTDEDVDELKACIELGFGFDSPEVVDQRLSDTLPALGLYHAINKQYYDNVSRSSTASECESSSSLGSPHTMFDPGENPQTVKTRLRQWAQVVACSVRQFSSG